MHALVTELSDAALVTGWGGGIKQNKIVCYDPEHPKYSRYLYLPFKISLGVFFGHLLKFNCCTHTEKVAHSATTSAAATTG